MMIAPHMQAYALALPFTAASAGESLYRLWRCRRVPGAAAAAAVLDEGAYIDASGDVAVSETEELEWTMRLQEASEWQQLLAASSLGDVCAAVWSFTSNLYPSPPFTSEITRQILFSSWPNRYTRVTTSAASSSSSYHLVGTSGRGFERGGEERGVAESSLGEGGAGGREEECEGSGVAPPSTPSSKVGTDLFNVLRAARLTVLARFDLETKDRIPRFEHCVLVFVVMKLALLPLTSATGCCAVHVHEPSLPSVMRRARCENSRSRK